MYQQGKKNFFGGDDLIKEDIINLKFMKDFYGENNNVEIINDKFKKNAKSMLLFYKPTCPACKNFDNIYNTLAIMLHGKFNFGKINVDDYINKNDLLTRYFNINSVPSIVIKDKEYKLYKGNRDLASLTNFICSDSNKCNAIDTSKIMDTKFKLQ